MQIVDKNKISIDKQGINVLTKIMQQITNTILEKKNQQQQLQNVSHQFEQFKNNRMEKFNKLRSDQQ